MGRDLYWITLWPILSIHIKLVIVEHFKNDIISVLQRADSPGAVVPVCQKHLEGDSELMKQTAYWWSNKRSFSFLPLYLRMHLMPPLIPAILIRCGNKALCHPSSSLIASLRRIVLRLNLILLNRSAVRNWNFKEAEAQACGSLCICNRFSSCNALLAS